LKVHYT